MTNKNYKIIGSIISEIAFFVFLYYIQQLLKVEENLWLSTTILWVLANISIAYCPVLETKCNHLK